MTGAPVERAGSTAIRRRTTDSRDRLLDAAAVAFCANGYFNVSVEDVAAAAGVSRMTFYRHFTGKPAIAATLFDHNSQAALPEILATAPRAPVRSAAVTAWLTGLFASDRAHRQLLRVFTQAGADEPGFIVRAHRFVDDLVNGLGAFIPAFAIDRATDDGARRWIEAWLLVYEILDQSNHAALGIGIATDSLVVEVLAHRFLRFTEM